MIIKILGFGCSNCDKLEVNIAQAIKELGIEAKIQIVDELEEMVPYGIMRSCNDLKNNRDNQDAKYYGIMKTPSLVINEKVIKMGNVLSVEEIKKTLKRFS